MVTIYNTTLSATSQRHFSDGLGPFLWTSKSGVDARTVLRHGHLAHRCFSGIPANRDDWKVKTIHATKAEATIASGVWGVGSIWH